MKKKSKAKAKPKAKKKYLTPSPELQKAFDAFPKLIKLKQKAAREKKRIMKNFLSVKDEVYKE